MKVLAVGDVVGEAGIDTLHGLLRRVKHLHQIIPVASGSVFGRKFDIGTHGLGISDHLFYLRQNLFPRFIQFGFQVNIAGG